MASYLWRKYADYLYSKWEKTILWDMVDPYRRPKSFTPLVSLYVLAFYTGVIGSAITEQLYKEKYWEDHPGEAVPIMRPKFYKGPWKILKGDVPAPGHQPNDGNLCSSVLYFYVLSMQSMQINSIAYRNGVYGISSVDPCPRNYLPLPKLSMGCCGGGSRCFEDRRFGGGWRGR
ncbi:hypothetical protein RHSIM_Rhsim03G0233100 [Rhododendron simsii]|uniref:Embryo defective protein n=1 Tax=Rhododendron simsii TaxID=118357 RepID=A0A834LT02_RHOSS|nr:hypothetical protein RHSIM_Rhsim03G0233100 [Rhododendron simsii]